MIIIITLMKKKIISWSFLLCRPFARRRIFDKKNDDDYDNDATVQNDFFCRPFALRRTFDKKNDDDYDNDATV